MERGNAKHSPRADDMLTAELSGTLGRGGSNREEWVDPEPPADDDVPARSDPPAEALPVEERAETAAEARARHDLDVANDWHES